MIKIDKFKKSKKGSGLIIVIMTFAFLSIVGVAFISMSVSSCKLRIAKSNAKTGLYGAESGIDEAYGIIGNKVDESIDKGDKQVNQFVKEVNSIIQNPEKKINQNGIFINLDHKEWKDYYNSCIDKKKDYKNNYICTLIDDEFKACQNEIFKKSYKDNILGSESDNGIVDELNDENNYKFKIQENGIKEIPKIVAKGKEPKEKEQDKLITINIKSNFIHKDIPKEITTNYEIYTPDYNKAYYKEIENRLIPKYPILSKNMLIDGSMEIKGQTDVAGDIYVKGEKNIHDNNGIILNSSEDVMFSGKVATPKDFKFIGKTNCSVKGNLFANNVQIKKDAGNSTLNVINASMYTNDDLEIDASGSEVKIDGAYYGLSDGRKSEKANQSSSININAVDNNGKIDCLLRIEDLTNQGSIIMGTSYADFIRGEGEKYQTGESLSIKGNYKAYSFPLISSDKYENDTDYKKLLDVEYEYYKFEKNTEYPPIPFVYKFLKGDKLYALDKSKYFKYVCEDNYYSKLINKGNLEKKEQKEKGVYINCKQKDENKKNIYIGSIVSDGRVYESRYSLDKEIQDEISSRKKIYEEETYKENKFINNEKIVENAETENLKNIIIKNKSVSSGEIKGLLNNGEPAIIIINGDLKVYSKLEFTGLLIVTGNLTIGNSGSLDIKYDKEGVMKLIGDNYEVLKDILVDDGTEGKYKFEDKENIGIVDKKVIIRKDKLIQMKNWKIVK